MNTRCTKRRRHALSSLSRYWSEDAAICHIDVLGAKLDVIPSPSTWRFELIDLPAWAANAAVDGKLLVPTHCITPGDAQPWERTDWLMAAFILLEAVPEREFEIRHGSIHSYSLRLSNWDSRLWDRAWVNRIALFLRCWAARNAKLDEDFIFGKLPPAEIMLTHDVDAIQKRWPIRIKQSAFSSFNAVRETLNLQWKCARESAFRAVRFLFAKGSYDRIDEIISLEKERGLNSCFHFFSGSRNGLVAKLIDPAYDIMAKRTRECIDRVVRQGYDVGLHPAYATWNSAERLRWEKLRLETVSGREVANVRQHWLRFSWAATWEAQSAAGLKLDSTLGFNDRPGFRASAALRWRPWSESRQDNLPLEVLPLLFMDSHFYDYLLLTPAKRREQMSRWIEEVRAVSGIASVLWHPHSLDPDYGWKEGFLELLEQLERLK